MDCPNCGLVNPDSALQCDCGYSFSNNTFNYQTSSSAQFNNKNITTNKKINNRFIVTSAISFIFKILGWVTITIGIIIILVSTISFLDTSNENISIDFEKYIYLGLGFGFVFYGVISVFIGESLGINLAIEQNTRTLAELKISELNDKNQNTSLVLKE